MTEDFRATVARIRKAKGLDLEDIAFEGRRALGEDAVSLSLIQKRLAPGSDRGPSRELLLTLAAGLGEKPEVFDDYKLLVARDLLDPRRVGLDAAMKNLGDVRDAMRTAARSQTPHATAPPASSGKSKRAGQRAPRKAAGG